MIKLSYTNRVGTHHIHTTLEDFNTLHDSILNVCIGALGHADSASIVEGLHFIKSLKIVSLSVDVEDSVSETASLN